ncbi:MAG: tRNA (adenosine(37)-N6)-threonylcarbamoyltransferase complex dimerization subunit type 1 TsaB, partial [Candidatus Omnitrophica bacterium]|nr:tRNA (adenosine(37)-N6)-threonylcarbamoyltransferase complex dimerization subunit type 1 TsaB [Candidatus Omnitrophota bacterium]
MNLLAIDTATRQLSVALLKGETLIASQDVLTAEHPHATLLPETVARVLKGAGLTLSQVEGVAVDLGPGSFTGLRIGLAFVKGLLFRKSVPVVGIPSLDVLAAGLGRSSSAVGVVLDAKQQKVYAARYRPDADPPQRQGEYVLGQVQDALAGFPEGPLTLLGDGCAVYREQIAQRLPKARIAPTEFWWPRAAVLGRLGALRLQQGQADDLATLVPMYLYAQDCGVHPSSRLPTQPR